MIPEDLRACEIDGNLARDRRAWKAEFCQPASAVDGKKVRVD